MTSDSWLWFAAGFACGWTLMFLAAVGAVIWGYRLSTKKPVWGGSGH